MHLGKEWGGLFIPVLYEKAVAAGILHALS
jgi:hypothetical protein